MTVLILCYLPAKSQGTDLYPLISFYRDLGEYVEKPKRSDTECRSEKERALKDISLGNISFCTPTGFMFGQFRSEETLNALVQDMGLNFEIDPYSDLIYDKQTQGCYCAVMTNHLAEKYGKEFRAKMYRKADSLYVKNVFANNLVVDAWFTDFRPGPDGQGPVEGYALTLGVDSLNLSLDMTETLIMDIEFVIELDRSMTNFQVSYHWLNTESNETYLSTLRDFAFERIKSTEVWNPGQLKGRFVRTKQNIRVNFVSGKK